MHSPAAVYHDNRIIMHLLTYFLKTSPKNFHFSMPSERRSVLPFKKSQCASSLRHPVSLPNGRKKMRGMFSQIFPLSFLWSCSTLSLLFAIIVNLYVLLEAPFSSVLEIAYCSYCRCQTVVIQLLSGAHSKSPKSRQ